MLTILTWAGWTIFCIILVSEVYHIGRSINDRDGSSHWFVGGALVATLAAGLYLLGAINLVAYVTTHFGIAALWLAKYVGIGFGYMLLRLLAASIHVAHQHRDMLDRKYTIFMERMREELPEGTSFDEANFLNEWKAYKAEKGWDRPGAVEGYRPRAFAWWMLWPADLLYNGLARLIDWPIKLFDFVWNRVLKGFAQRVHNFIWTRTMKGSK